MDKQNRFQDIHGILSILADDPKWPNPANLYLIPDEKGFSAIDVGCGGHAGLDHFLRGLDHWGLELRNLHTVVLSHAHPDHMGALESILTEVDPRVLIHDLDVVSALDPGNLSLTFDIPFAKHCWASTPNSNGYDAFDLLTYFEQVGCPMCRAQTVEAIREGDILRLGDFALEVIHTPGHSPGHVSLFDRARGILLGSDLVGKSPAWYTPTGGGVIGYLESLAKLETRDATMILPSHGPILEEPDKAIQTIRHRLLERDVILLQTLSDGPRPFLEVSCSLFQGPFKQFFPGCAITEAHLIKLEREGIIRREGDRIERVRDAEVVLRGADE
jgi:glyoxylase-like metal-dependent hydrolase (beta-lactamase superfamily II)